MELDQILEQYQLNKSTVVVATFGSGLINRTWLVKDQHKKYILQRINDQVFTRPQDIASNIDVVGRYLSEHHPEYFFIRPVKTINGRDLVYLEAQGYFRLLPFVPNSHTVDVVSTPSQAFEAARQFGRFTKLLSDFNVNKLKITLRDFHNLSLRYQQFEDASLHGDPGRIKESKQLKKQLEKLSDIVVISKSIQHNRLFKKRVTHHDTKISNVLFDEKETGICVIDLDTVMPGYFISDVGDMLRTYLSPVSEEETDFSKIEIREEYFFAVQEGYLSEMYDALSMLEREHFIYAGKFMIYMQALRFLTDHMNKDKYYGARYEGHNLVRANNQLILLQRIIEKEKYLLAHSKSAS